MTKDQRLIGLLIHQVDSESVAGDRYTLASWHLQLRLLFNEPNNAMPLWVPGAMYTDANNCVNKTGYPAAAGHWCTAFCPQLLFVTGVEWNPTWAGTPWTVRLVCYRCFSFLNCQTGMLQMFFILNGVTAAGLALKVNARDTSSRRGGACTGFSKHADPNYYPEQNWIG